MYKRELSIIDFDSEKFEGMKCYCDLVNEDRISDKSKVVCTREWNAVSVKVMYDNADGVVLYSIYDPLPSASKQYWHRALHIGQYIGEDFNLPVWAETEENEFD